MVTKRKQLNRLSKIDIRVSDEKCKHCHEFMQRRKWKKPPQEKTYYFKEWDYCPRCKYVQHYDQFKSSVWREQEEQEHFINSI